MEPKANEFEGSCTVSLHKISSCFDITLNVWFKACQDKIGHMLKTTCDFIARYVCFSEYLSFYLVDVKLSRAERVRRSES